jgi:hypothetical protein
MRPGRVHAALLAAVALLAVGAPAAPAAKKPGKLRTATASASSAATGVLTTVATCPKGTKVVGGGFLTTAPTTDDDFLNPLESRREGGRAWLVSAYRVDTAAAGPAMGLTAEAYCRSRPGKLLEKIYSIPILGAANTAAPVATCPLGRAAVSGGFSIGPPVVADDFHSALYDNVMSGSVGWVLRAINLTDAPDMTEYISRVYCQKKGKKPPRFVAAGSAVSTAAFASGTATTPPCPGKRNTFAGGFLLPPFIGTPAGLPLVTESRHVGKNWRVSASRLTGGTEQIFFTAIGYCS